MIEPAAIQAHIMDRADFLRARPEYKKPRPGTIIRTRHEEMMIYAVNANRMAAENKQIKFDLTYSEHLPQVLADSEKTAWVLNNLLSNAIRHSHDNSTIHLRIHMQNKKIIFTVKDTGHGIAPEYKNKIFDRYFRVPGSQKEGTGLGLAISKEFIEAQGGEIKVESEIGVGSVFQVVLNAA